MSCNNKNYGYKYKDYRKNSGKIPIFILSIILLYYIFIFTNSSVVAVIFAATIYFVILKPLFKYKKEDTDNNNYNTAISETEKHIIKTNNSLLTDGEKYISDLLSRNLSHKDYFIYSNVIIPSDKTTTSQIDHLIISKYGIFVIESKDYNGWIFGNPYQDNWTQSLPGGNKFHFRNPIKQNWSHIIALKKFLPFLDSSAFFDIVVFNVGCDIKTPMNKVLYSFQLIDYIKSKNVENISQASLYMAIGKLSHSYQTSDISNVEHTQNLNNHFINKLSYN